MVCTVSGIFHAFHHSWIEEIQRALNAGLLPADYYALPEQQAAGFGPDVLTLQGESTSVVHQDGGGVLLEEPQVRLVAESDQEFYRQKQKSVVVRHVTGDRMVAVV